VWADLIIPNQIGGPIKDRKRDALEIKGKREARRIRHSRSSSGFLGTMVQRSRYGCNAALVVDALRAIKASA